GQERARGAAEVPGAGAGRGGGRHRVPLEGGPLLLCRGGISQFEQVRHAPKARRETDFPLPPAGRELRHLGGDRHTLLRVFWSPDSDVAGPQPLPAPPPLTQAAPPPGGFPASRLRAAPPLPPPRTARP